MTIKDPNQPLIVCCPRRLGENAVRIDYMIGISIKCKIMF